MRDKTTFIQKHSIKLVLLVCLLGGSLGVSWLEPYRGTEHLAAYGEHFFMAIAISGAIGLVIEFTLYKELAKNVFEAAIGYLLPPELHDGDIRHLQSGRRRYP